MTLTRNKGDISIDDKEKNYNFKQKLGETPITIQ